MARKRRRTPTVRHMADGTIDRICVALDAAGRTYKRWNAYDPGGMLPCVAAIEMVDLGHFVGAVARAASQLHVADRLIDVTGAETEAFITDVSGVTVVRSWGPGEPTWIFY